MFEISIPLEMIQPNPWQPRESEDPEHIKALALSIARDSLMQKPLGRIVLQDGEALRQEVLNLYHGADPDAFLGTMRTGNWSVQLAFGHSRLAAYRWLVDVGLRSNIPGDYTLLPLVIRQLNDEEMFRFAISENLQRRDLTPIEEARAMVRYRDEFEKNSAEIGTLFGLSDSAVRNKMRLLTLPATVQDMLRSRQITEGQARALVGLYNLPENLLEQGEALESAATPSQILEMAASGVGPTQIAAAVESLTNLLTGPQPKQMDIFEVEHAEKIEPQFDGKLVESEILGEEMGSAEQKLDKPLSDSAVTVPITDETTIHAETVSTETVDADATAVKSDPEDQNPVLADQRTAQHLRPDSADETTQRQRPEPEAIVVIEKPTWAASTITLTLTLWPEDGHADGRLVMMGARVNEDAPVMQMLRQTQLELTPQLTELLANLSKTYQE